MELKRFMIATVLAAAPFAASAEVSYNYLEAGLTQTDIDVGVGDVDGSGIALAASFEFNDEVFFTGGYSTADLDFVDYNELNLRVGYHTSTRSDAQFVVTGGFVRAEVDAGFFGDESESGFGVSVGGRGELDSSLEWDLFLNYVDIEGVETSFSGAVRYRFTPTLSVGGGAEFGDDITRYGIFFRWHYD